MFSKRTIVVLAILLTGGMIAASTAFAAGSGSSSQRPARKSDYTKAVAAVKAGNFSTAIALMEKVVARDSRHADGYNYLAFSHRKLGHFDLAMKYYRKALAIAADGRHSPVRRDAGIATTEWSYPQTAIVCTVAHERPHHGAAQERFLPAGPFAILPMTDDGAVGHRSSIVWTERAGLVPALLALGDGVGGGRVVAVTGAFAVAVAVGSGAGATVFANDTSSM